ncbi:plasmid replication initiator TrfA [Piscirickettsia litoralis]|uniref:TrfA family protein n=1 Tax=Piscirickettsia litoralis TaxID=1891921 RepID=A0ABX2ZXS8_9GAMM|nr:plasmid replication initiator TrfA [Piscirickettsia litoralis]ODN41387.1 hypothetical protein BGC07_16595 [Piscirickettsia litoralis]
MAKEVSSSSIAEIIKNIEQKGKHSSLKKKTVFNDDTAQKLMAMKQPCDVIPFPVQPSNDKSILPYHILRSALFGIVKRGARKEFRVSPESMKGEEIAAYGSVKIRYSGYQLDQADLDTWMCCLELIKSHGFGATVHVTPYEMLTTIGRRTNNESYKWLDKSVRRLNQGTVEIEAGKQSYCGHLIDTFIYDSDRKKFILKIDTKISQLFSNKSYTFLEREKRKKLKGDLAKWLYGYILSHDTKNNVHCISLEKIRKLCGSQSPMRNFKISLQNAIKQLEKEGNEIAKGYIEDGKLYITRL